jgi:hypothetical protein
MIFLLQKGMTKDVTDTERGLTNSDDHTTEEVILRTGDPDLVNPKVTDEKLIEIVREDMERDNGKFEKLFNIAKKNKRYYVGDQVDERKLKRGLYPAVVNRVFVSIETMAAIITSVTPEPYVIVTPRGQQARNLKDKLERHLRDEWEFFQNMQQKFEQLMRMYYMSRVSFLKVRWNDTFDDFEFKPVKLKKLRFDMDAITVDDSPFFSEKVKLTIGELRVMFPDKQKEIDKILAGFDSSERKGDRSDIVITEYWGKYLDDKGKVVTYVTWIYQDTVFDRILNPYWNTNGDNHFRVGRFPYIPLNSISIAESMVDETSPIEQAIPLQDLINKRKRQIDRNAGNANGKWVASSDAMSQSQFDGIGPNTDKIFLDGDDPNPNGLSLQTGRALDGGVFADLQDSKREIDNIFGTHETTRGELGAASETLGGQRLRRDSDFGRLDLTARSYEQVAEEVYNWMVQMMYVKYKAPKDIASVKEEGVPEDRIKNEVGMNDKDIDTISKKDFKGHRVKVIVKRGTTRPKDPAALAADAVTLRQTGVLNPITFFEMYGAKNPQQEARREFLWHNSPEMLFPELTGYELYEPGAIIHIKDINARTGDATDEPFESDDVETYVKHVETHGNYIRGIDILGSDTLPLFEELPVDIQEDQKAHLEVEQAILEQKIQELEAQAALEQEQGGAIPGEEIAPEGALPPEAGAQGAAPPLL